MTLSRRHVWMMIGLTLMSVLLHAIVTVQVGSSLPTVDEANESKIKRMEATYVKEVKLSAPPVAVARPVAPPAAAPSAGKGKNKKVKPPQDKASAPEEAASGVAQAASEAAVEPKPETKVAEASPPPPPASAASSPPKGPVFEWPKATKVSFNAEGYLRGKITGSAEIEWVRQDDKYQVFFDILAGGIASIQGSSEGLITPEGLYPKLTEFKTKIGFSEHLQSFAFERDEITLPNGNKIPRPPELQDFVSLPIQLMYRFTIDPELLKPGNSVKFNVATRKEVTEFVFDVTGEEIIDTPMGPINAIHVKPRGLTDRGLPFPPSEIWFAPTLQYLPIKFYMERTDGPREKQFNVTMQLKRPPQQVSAQD